MPYKKVAVEWRNAALILCLIGTIEAHPEKFADSELKLCREVGKALSFDMARVYFDEE